MTDFSKKGKARRLRAKLCGPIGENGVHGYSAPVISQKPCSPAGKLKFGLAGYYEKMWPTARKTMMPMA